jgi:hypothetical protein
VEGLVSDHDFLVEGGNVRNKHLVHEGVQLLVDKGPAYVGPSRGARSDRGSGYGVCIVSVHILGCLGQSDAVRNIWVEDVHLVWFLWLGVSQERVKCRGSHWRRQCWAGQCQGLKQTLG